MRLRDLMETFSERVSEEPQTTRGRSKYSTYQSNFKAGRKSSSLMNLCGKTNWFSPDVKAFSHWCKVRFWFVGLPLRCCTWWEMVCEDGVYLSIAYVKRAMYLHLQTQLWGQSRTLACITHTTQKKKQGFRLYLYLDKKVAKGVLF